MTVIQKLFIISFFAFIALFSQNSNAQSNIQKKHISTITHEPLTASAATGNNNFSGDIAGLPNGVNIVAQTREHVLLAVIMEKGRMTGMGSIDPNGGFHEFQSDAPCRDFEALPCSDSSKPSVYFDPYLKKCIGVCDDVIDLDPVGYQPIEPYNIGDSDECILHPKDCFSGFKAKR